MTHIYFMLLRLRKKLDKVEERVLAMDEDKHRDELRVLLMALGPIITAFDKFLKRVKK